MQNKFWTLITAFIDLIIATIGGFFLNNILESSYASERKWMFGLLLLIAVFFSYAINTLVLCKLYDRFHFIRRWFIPESYIEGTWIQIIDDDKLKGMPPTKYSLIHIKMKDGRIIVEGHSYNQENNGMEMTHFTIPYTTFISETNTLEYHYDFFTREYRDASSYIGKASLTFEKLTGKRYFNKYNGTVISNLPRGRNKIMVRAFKNTNKIKLKSGKKIKIDETTLKRQDVRDHIDLYIKRIF